jgi:AcrR family transcriptional regulator
MAVRSLRVPSPPEAESDTRDRVLLEAARLFRHRGYAATTLREIATATGIKAGSIYYHFASKEVILGEVLDKGMQVVFDAVRERVDSLPAEASWRERIRACIEGHLWGMLQYGDFTSANIRMYSQLPTSAKNRNRALRRAYADYWERLFQGALDAGELRQDCSTAVARLFVVGALNWTVEWHNPQSGPFLDFVRQITAMVFDGIMEPKGR